MGKTMLGTHSYELSRTLEHCDVLSFDVDGEIWYQDKSIEYNIIKII